MANYSEEDVGNIIALEHVNVQISDQALATLFYVVGLGGTRDPYMNVGLNNMWINFGEQQFHLPTRTPQVIDGHIGMVVPNLDALEKRLQSVAEGLKGNRFSYQRERDHLAVTCPWGNRYRCYAAGPEYADMAVGMPYVEFNVPAGAAQGIVGFYQTAFATPATLESGPRGRLGRVQIGRHQALRFRETDQPIRPYDGHHVAIYVANFSGPYGFLRTRGAITEDVRNHQFRFKDLIDPDDGKCKFQLEHEVRSLRHPMYQRPFVNRDSAQSQRDYRRGWDAFTPYQR